MAIDNYILNMQKQIKARNNLKDLINEIQAIRTEAKHLFIFKSVKDYIGHDITLDEAYHELGVKYGFHKTKLFNIAFKGSNGAKKLKILMLELFHQMTFL